MIDEDEVKRRFSYHAPDDKRRAAHEDVREAFKRLVRHIVDLTPESREQSLAVTALEEAMFWTNAAIARH